MATTNAYINKLVIPKDSNGNTYTAYLIDNTSGYTKNTGTVTSITVNTTSPITGGSSTASTSTGSWTIGHSKPSTSPAKSTSAVYPITVDEYGHITATGTAVTIPAAVTESTVAGWGFTKNTGTVTSVTASGALASSGGTTPAITHNKPSTSPAKTTQALYPIKIDEYGHITAAGSAVTPVTSVTASGVLTSSGGTTPAITHNAPSTSPAKSTQAVYPITIDSYGHIATAGTAVTIPTGIPSGGSSGQFLGWNSSGTAKWVANPNTDTKQNITLATTTKTFITGVSTTPTSTAQGLTGLADTGVYLTTTAGQINATTYKVNEAVTLQYNSTTKSLDFIFA